jgi:hypothetical protein
MYKVTVRQTAQFETIIDADNMESVYRKASVAPFDHRDVIQTEILSVQPVPDHPDRD